MNANAAWFCPESKEPAQQIKGRVAFWKGVRVAPTSPQPRQRSPGPPAVELRGRACRLGGLPAAVAPAAPAGGGERLRTRSHAGGCSPGGGGLRIGACTTRDGMLGWRSLPADREGLVTLNAHLSRWPIPARRAPLERRWRSGAGQDPLLRAGQGEAQHRNLRPRAGGGPHRCRNPLRRQGPLQPLRAIERHQGAAVVHLQRRGTRAVGVAGMAPKPFSAGAAEGAARVTPRGCGSG